MATTIHGSFALALEALKEHEMSTNARYAVLKATKGFGKGDVKRIKQVLWKDKRNISRGRQDFTGTPFAVTGLKVLECQFGRERRSKSTNVQSTDHGYCVGKKFLAQPSKKKNCPATVSIREIVRFPSYKAEEITPKTGRKEMEQDILCRLACGHHVDVLLEYILCLPDMHEGHPTDDVALPQPIDMDISQEIKKMTNEGVDSVPEMKRHIKTFIKEKYRRLPHPSNKRFYPSSRTIGSHMYLARKVDGDQQNTLDSWITERRNLTPDDFFFYRKKTEEDTFLFVHQTCDQRRLLNRYGSFVLMDSTYKTSVFDLPLFFLVLKTNTDYQVAGCFITEVETADAIAEALQKIKDENELWKPSFFMTDFDESEVNAIERVFKDARVLLCEFHRLQSWQRWMKRQENNVVNPSELLKCLKDLAHSKTPNMFEENLADLKKSSHWTENLKKYLEKVWLPVKERWCYGYRVDNPEIRCSTTNPVEATHKTFKQYYLNKKTTLSLPSMVRCLAEDFLPDKYKKYVDLNRKYSSKYKNYTENIPPFLHNRPHSFIQHCLDRLEKGNHFSTNDISKTGGGWLVQSKEKTYRLSLGDEYMFPTCECRDWQDKAMPCKHMFAVMTRDGKVVWESLSSKYRSSPYYIIDEEVLSPRSENTSDTQWSCVDNSVTDGDWVTEHDYECSSPDLSKDTEKDIESGSGNKSLASVQHSCREKLKVLTNKTYNIDKVDCLIQLNKSLQALIETYCGNETELPKILPLKKRKCFRRGRKTFSSTSKQKVNVKKDSHTDVMVDGIFDCPVSCSKEDMTSKNPPLLPENFDINLYPDICNEVEKVWRMEGDITPHAIGPYTLTSSSIQCINTLLSDEVIDAFLHKTCSAQPKVYHLNCIAITAIFDGIQEVHHNLRRMPSLLDYDQIIGAYNQGRCHWCLLIIVPKERKIVYINPLGSVNIHEQNIVLNWFKFLKARFDAGLENSLPEEWTLETPQHARQIDGSSCGLYTLKMAENFLAGRSLDFVWAAEDIKKARLSLAVYLLGVSRNILGRESKETDREKYTIRKNTNKRKRSSFIYPDLKKKPRKTYCLCNKAYNKEFMICCDRCENWYHPFCLGLKESDLPDKEDPFICAKCGDFELPDMLRELDPEDLESEDKFYINKTTACKHMNAAYIRILKIVTNNKKIRQFPWMKRHTLSREGNFDRRYGYGFAVFSQPAILAVSHIIKEKFQKSSSRFTKDAHSVMAMKDKCLLKAFDEDKYLAGVYIAFVLIREGLCAIFEDITGADYESANKECSTIMDKSQNRAVYKALEIGQNKKCHLQERYGNQ